MHRVTAFEKEVLRRDFAPERERINKRRLGGKKSLMRSIIVFLYKMQGFDYMALLKSASSSSIWIRMLGLKTLSRNYWYSKGRY